MPTLHTNFRLALRGFIRTPVFTLTALATLALGIGGLAVIFALVNALLLRPLPVREPGGLVTLELRRGSGSGSISFSYPQFELLRSGHPGLSGLAALSLDQLTVAVGNDEPESLLGYSVSGNYFDVLGLRPETGRLLTPRDEFEVEAAPAVVIGHQLWQRRFGGRHDAVGTVLRINGQPFTIVGVAPQDYRGTIPAVGASFWVPVTAQALLQPGSTFRQPGMMHWLTLVGRLAPGTGRSQAEALLSSRALVLAAAEPDAFDGGRRTRRPAVSGVALATLRPVPPMAVTPLFGFFGVLFTAAALVLLIASVNITSMMLARATARTREMAVRRSLGAVRGQLVMQLMMENVLLFVFGAVVGLLLAAWTMSAIPIVTRSVPLPIDFGLSLEPRVITFAFAAALLAGVLFGLAPALHGSGSSTMPALREGTAAPRATRLRSGFVVAQIALSLLLLLSAGLLGRALQRALAVDPGFSTTNVAVLGDIDLGPFGYDAHRSAIFFAAVTERLLARSDIDAAAYASSPPLAGFAWRWFRPEGHDAAPQEGVNFIAVDPGFLHTLGVPLTEGRGFAPEDRAGAPRVAIVNEEFVRRFWPGESAIGKRLFEGAQDQEQSFEVIGVTRTGRYRSLNEDPLPFVYLARAQEPVVTGAIFARSRAGSAAAVAAIRQEVRALDADLPTVLAAPLQQTLSVLLLPQRIAAVALATFGVIGLLLSIVGIYGLVAFTASQRTREIGVRMALGAQRRHVEQLFLRQSARLLLVGTVVGLVLARAAGGLLSSLLYGTSPMDPLIFVTLPLLLAVAALLAAYLPARRASSMSPMVVLRSE